MTTTKRIARTATKKIDAVFGAVTKATAYTLSNEFRGHDVPLDYVRGGLKAAVLEGRGRLFERAPGKFSVDFHSNSWVVMEVAISELHYARLDCRKAAEAMDKVDRELGGDRAGRYRDEGSVYAREMARRAAA